MTTSATPSAPRRRVAAALATSVLATVLTASHAAAAEDAGSRPVAIEIVSAHAVLPDGTSRPVAREPGARHTSARTVVVARITIQPGGRLPWHALHGPAVLSVTDGTLSARQASDCVDRRYGEHETAVRGADVVHTAWNPGPEETVVLATFFDVPDGAPLTRRAMPYEYCAADDGTRLSRSGGAGPLRAFE